MTDCLIPIIHACKYIPSHRPHRPAKHSQCRTKRLNRYSVLLTATDACSRCVRILALLRFFCLLFLDHPCMTTPDHYASVTTAIQPPAANTDYRCNSWPKKHGCQMID
ncbi:hypothetical protein BDV38DRAFT_28536 [Aspergillus pseudotamarii]|uniref:Uncharacterized protein n=1 Tax=Aspergillus pseudotamarii TaxID=132259 RepID=A0A5N6T1Z9_ASPPS|nr:uncharacterized protein BDV38DRAFT_28536 [Aspergillus pseudotamarii]KAE8140322.1 hypothetical protein BDV38DRAFT_28536 [Aspergillus pseudotamarii]